MKRLWASLTRLAKPNRILTDRKGKIVPAMSMKMKMRMRTKTKKKMNSQMRKRSRVIR